METKQVIVMRKDLNMRTGKMIAQGAHASLAVITNLIERRVTGPWYFSPPPEVEEWLNNSFTKICVYVNSEEKLLKLYEHAESLNLPCSLIKDSGRTEFHGVPTYTAVAVGPAECCKVDEVTGGLPLL